MLIELFAISISCVSNGLVGRRGSGLAGPPPHPLWMSSSLPLVNNLLLDVQSASGHSSSPALVGCCDENVSEFYATSSNDLGRGRPFPLWTVHGRWEGVRATIWAVSQVCLVVCPGCAITGAGVGFQQ